jgi:hypothetical protein
VNQEQFYHSIRAACAAIDSDHVIVIGSQSILGSFTDEDLPAEATMSREIDILPEAATHEQTAALADVLEGVAGELSQFDESFGFYLDGVATTRARCMGLGRPPRPAPK